MAKRRDWHMSVQHEQYMITLYELKWWHPIPERIGWVFLELGTRIRFDKVSEWVSEIGQRAYQKSDEAEIPMMKIDISKDQARELHPDFVSIFEDDD